MSRARGSPPSRSARSAGYTAAPAEAPWPSDDIRALIAKLRADRASLEWEKLRLTLLRMAARLRSRYSDVPDEPDDIAQCVLLNFSEQDSLAQFGRPAEALTPAQQWSRERFLAWLFQCVQNTWRMRRRQMLARPVTVDLAAREVAGLAERADDLTLVEAAADGSLLACRVAQLLAIWEERSPTARAQAYCFRAYAKAQLEEAPLDEIVLAERYRVRPGTIRVWLHRIRLQLQAQLQRIEDETALADQASVCGEDAASHVSAPRRTLRACQG